MKERHINESMCNLSWRCLSWFSKVILTISFLVTKTADPAPADKIKKVHHIDAPFLFIYTLLASPLSAAVAEEEDNASARPVGEEAPPNSDKPEAETAAEEGA